MNDRISLVVEISGLTKTAFGRRINVSQSLISQICSGAAKPSDRTISDICREFGVDRTWLETGVGEPFVPRSKQDVLKDVFADVLSGRVSEKNAFIEAVSQLPDDVYPVLVRSWIAAAEQMKERLKNKQAE